MIGARPAQLAAFWILLAGILVATGCGTGGANTPPTLTVYSGRNERLVGPLLTQFAEQTGTDIQVRYGDTAAMAATILEEGDSSPTDVFFAQDAGALGAVEAAGRLRQIPEATLTQVDQRYRSPAGQWVGVSGRARVVAYNTNVVQESDLPDSILGFTDPKWRGRIGWAPTNGSFQSFITALRLTEGEDGARSWLEGIQANDPKVYANNLSIVDAVARGEIDAGFVNHYYLYTIQREQGQEIPVRNYHPRAGGPGAMINVAGAGILNSSQNPQLAERFVEFLLSPEAQRYFAVETSEYPLVSGIETIPGLEPLSQINAPNIDLGNLSDLDGTLRLLRETGVL